LKIIHAQIRKNEKLSWFVFQFFVFIFQNFLLWDFFSPKKNKMLSQTSQEKPNIRRSIPDNGAKNLM